MNKDDKPIIVEQTFSVPVEVVWKSITEHDQMIKWFFENIPSFKAEVGFKTQFIVENEGRVFPHLWEITEVIPNNKITYSWKYEDYPGLAYVTFELFEQNDLTLLKLTNTVVESFPDNIPEFRRESCIGGWEFFIKSRLTEYLTK